MPYCNAAITNCPARSSRLIASTMRLARSEVPSVLGVGEGDAVCGMEMVVLGAGDDVRLGTDVGAALPFVVSESVAWRTGANAPIAMATIANVTMTVVTIRTMRLFRFGCGLSLCWIMVALGFCDGCCHCTVRGHRLPPVGRRMPR